MSTDLSGTVAPKSDQLNADDLIVGPRTIVVKAVNVSAKNGGPGDAQPVAISFEGDGGRPYLPCKSMRRVLIHAWGSDGAAYIGRSMTLFRDPTVRFGGADVGGIRISHMSGIQGALTMSLTASKASRKPFTVLPLSTSTTAPAQAKKEVSPEEKLAKAREKAMAIMVEVAAAGDVAAVLTKHADMINRLKTVDASLADDISSAAALRTAALKVLASQSSDQSVDPLDD